MTAAGAAPHSRYQIIGHLASGGMGEILLARRAGPAGFEKLVVLKRPLAVTGGSPAVVAALIEEARLLAQVNHANVCQIHDLEESDGEYFLVLELLEGLSLWSILLEVEAADRSIAPRIVCGLIEQACVGLEAIHHLRARDGSPAGVIHRDVSPGNLFLTEDGTVKILDLGIAKRVNATEHTGAGTIRGKLPYIAPEQAACKRLDARTDVFALGLVFHDLVRGRRPASDRIGAFAHDALELDELSPPLAAIIRRAVAAEPDARFASAGALAAAVRAAVTDLGGACDRVELAAWLARDFATALEVQRERTRAAMSRMDDPTAVTRTLTLQSMLPVDERADEPLAMPPAAMLDAGSAEDLRVPAQHTERLASETGQLPRPWNPAVRLQGAALALAPSPRTPAPVPAPRSRVRWMAVGALAAVALGAMIAVLVRDPERAPPLRHTSAPSGGSSSSTSSPKSSPITASNIPTLPDRATSARAAADSAAADSGTVDSAAVGSAAVGSVAADSTAAGSAAAGSAAAGSAANSAELSPLPPSSSSAEPRVKPIAPRVSTGLFTIDSQPYAILTLGGRQLGQTPLFHQSVRTGRYTVHAAIPDGQTQDLSIRIDAGRECRVMLRWNGATTTRVGCQ